MKTVLQPVDAPNPPPEFVFNTDLSTVVLTDGVKTIYMARGSKARLKKLHLCPGCTANTTMDRNIGVMPTISAAGELVCCVATIKHEKIKEPQLVPVSVNFHFKKLICAVEQKKSIYLSIGPKGQDGASISCALTCAMYCSLTCALSGPASIRRSPQPQSR